MKHEHRQTSYARQLLPPTTSSRGQFRPPSIRQFRFFDPRRRGPSCGAATIPPSRRDFALSPPKIPSTGATKGLCSQQHFCSSEFRTSPPPRRRHDLPPHDRRLHGEARAERTPPSFLGPGHLREECGFLGTRQFSPPTLSRPAPTTNVGESGCLRGPSVQTRGSVRTCGTAARSAAKG